LLVNDRSACRLQVPTVEDQQPVQAGPHDAHHRSAYAVAVAARGGIFSACTPAAADTASNAALNVASSSRIRNRTVPPLAEIH
jgi:hypothetical protein